jgi:histidine triad (HIT) family protein
MPYTYDDQNVFAKILRGEIPCSKVLETPHSLAFNDIAPKTPHHVLVIPKGPYVCYDHFALDATEAEIVDYTRAIGQICAQLGVRPGHGGNGYRLIANSGNDGVQEVPHLHVHILAGRVVGPMVLMR